MTGSTLFGMLNFVEPSIKDQMTHQNSPLQKLSRKYLTLKAPNKIAADDILIFSFIFKRK